MNISGEAWDMAGMIIAAIIIGFALAYSTNKIARSISLLINAVYQVSDKLRANGKIYVTHESDKLPPEWKGQ